MKKKKRISPQIDMAILEGIASGYSAKELAKMYDVSESYISKVKTGKKVPNIFIKEPTLIKDEFFEVYNTELNEIINTLSDKNIIVDKKEIIEYLEVQVRKSIIRAKMFQELLNKYKGVK